MASMTTPQTPKKQPKPRRKKHRISRFRLALVLFVTIVVVSGALAFLLLARPGASGGNAEKPAVFGIHSITVAGETRYNPEAIIAASGIRKGQSIFSVKKVRAHDSILAGFPYIERVEVGNSSFDTVEIRVWEVDPIGAMYANGEWLVVGSNNKGVEALPLQGDRPNRYLYFKGVTLPEAENGGKVGGKAMDDRSFKVVTTLLASLEKHKLEHVIAFDLTEKTNIKLNWKNQITVLLGNETNLDSEIELLTGVLPELLKNNGDAVNGIFDLRSYSDDNKDNDQGIFTPSDVLAAQSATTGNTVGNATLPAE